MLNTFYVTTTSRLREKVTCSDNIIIGTQPGGWVGGGIFLGRRQYFFFFGGGGGTRMRDVF